MIGVSDLHDWTAGRISIGAVFLFLSIFSHAIIPTSYSGSINSGGIPLGGVMPAFEDKLTEKEKEAVMAYFMSLWPNRIYEAWEERNPS